MILAAALGCAAGLAFAAPVPRPTPVAGSIVSVKSGEEVDFVEAPVWREAEARQDLKAGDTLRTNAVGQLAILFADRTQIRVGRNSTLVVKEMGQGQDTRLGLTGGTIWARAARGGTGLTIDTPAAAAAIRGTDWSLGVDPAGKTALIVLEGVVELRNAQGSVTVRRGEGATAAIGQAPSKFVLVNPDDRQQMLFYLTLRDAFSTLPTTPLDGRGARAERRRILAIPGDRRSAEEAVVEAETALGIDGPRAARVALERARRRSLTAGQRARLDLVEAVVDGIDQRNAEAARLFARALPQLQGRRRTAALYGGYFARALADPAHREAPPRGDPQDRNAVLADAYIAGFLKNQGIAMEVLRRAGPRFRNDAEFQATLGALALVVDAPEEGRVAIDRALALDPDNVGALVSRARYRSDLHSDLDGALADLRHATEVSPGAVDAWNNLALVLDERGARREAEAAFRRAVELDPEEPISRINLAVLLLEQQRLPEAKAEIDRAMAADPNYDLAYAALGRYQLQAGDSAAAVESLLKATSANPAYSNALLTLAAAYYRNGDDDPAVQAADNAARLDPHDPIPPQVQSVFAIDGFRADDAIATARRSVELTRAQGGVYSSLGSSRDSGSALANAFRFLGLNAWARYYGDAVFDPFTSGGFFDQALAGSANPVFGSTGFVLDNPDPATNGRSASSLVQGLLLDPLAVASPERRRDIVRAPFAEATVQGGFNAGDRTGWNTEATLQGISNSPFPFAWSLDGSFARNDPTSFDRTGDTFNATAFITAAPTGYDNVMAYAAAARTRGPFGIEGLAAPATAFGSAREVEAANGGLAWSHVFGARNMASLAVFASGTRETDNLDDTTILNPALNAFLGLPGDLPLSTDVRSRVEQRTLIAAASHALGLGAFTLRYGVEGGAVDSRNRATFTVFPDTLALDFSTRPDDTRTGVGRAYADVRGRLSDTLEVEGALFGTALGGDFDRQRLEPRAGIAWSPLEGHWLRVGLLRETELGNSATLAPVDVIGLQPNQVPVGIGGRTDTAIARWDAEWSQSVFTAVEVQHQELRDAALTVPGSIASIDLDDAKIDRVSGSANLWLTHGIGVFGTLAYTHSDNGEDGAATSRIPFVPDLAGRAGVTVVHPSRVTLTVTENFVGSRATSLSDDREVGGFATTDARVGWETLDRRLVFDLGVYNIFDNGFAITPEVQGFGRTVSGSLKVRF